MEIPKPSDSHLKYKVLEGQWEGQETMYPSQWDRTGGIAIGRSKSRMALDGFALISDYEQERNGSVSYRGHGVFTYQPAARQYLLHWFDNMGNPAEVFTGVLDGNLLVFTHGGPHMHARMTYDLTTVKHSLASKMEMSQDGVNWSVLFEGQYTRL